MFDINDVVADQIIRSAHLRNGTDRGAFQTSLHPLNARVRTASAPAMVTTVTSGPRHTAGRLAAMLPERQETQGARCPAAV